ncbi:hypothetical protein UFOVP139_31 [uncultured Caudovirales phage]|uniref:Uncharacterized protein n=1 Tax=uncultured Caudovirales phage TaxID=2100421 RepID=A0A6J5LGH4_9CAUD|nr:hypothetical protein UFOVP139_31 [uncultured Caudovirales phage]
MKYYVGFDPGLDGAFAVLTAAGDIVQVFDMPTVEVLSGTSLKRKIAPAVIASELRIFTEEDIFGIVEQVSAMPGQGVTSMFNFGKSVGLLEGMLAGMGIPFTTVTPAQWKRKMGANASKDGARELAMRQWPAHADTFKRKKDDGRAEACLLALYQIKYGV